MFVYLADELLLVRQLPHQLVRPLAGKRGKVPNVPGRPPHVRACPVFLFFPLQTHGLEAGVGQGLVHGPQVGEDRDGPAGRWRRLPGPIELCGRRARVVAGELYWG